MAEHRFDSYSRLVAALPSRRKVLIVAFVLVAGYILGLPAKVMRLRADHTDQQGDSSAPCNLCLDLATVIDKDLRGGSYDVCISGALAAVTCKGPLALICRSVAAIGCISVDRMPDLKVQGMCSNGTLNWLVDRIPNSGELCPDSCGAGSVMCPDKNTCSPVCPDGWELELTACECSPPAPLLTSDKEDANPDAFGRKTWTDGISRWQFVVPAGQTLIIGASEVRVNGMIIGSNGTLVAYPAHTSVDVTVVKGFWTIVPESDAQTFFCGQLFPVPLKPGEVAIEYATRLPLKEWPDAQCTALIVGGELSTPDWEAYTSPFYGFRQQWDPSWTLSMKNSWWVGGPEGGYDQIRLDNGPGALVVTGTRRWGIDQDSCLNELMIGIEEAPGNDNVVSASDYSPASLGKLNGLARSRVLRYDYVNPVTGAFTDFLVQIDCLILPDEAGQVVFLFEAPGAFFDEQLGERAKMLNQFELPG